MFVSAIFVTLSLADLVLTWFMLERLDGAYEANPLAAQVLERFGWPGLTLHKLASVGLVLAIAGIIVKRRPRLGRFVLRVGCVSALVVVSYSVWLLLEPDGLLCYGRQLREANSAQTTLQERKEESDRFQEHADDLTKRLARGEVALPDAVTELSGLLRTFRWDPCQYVQTLFRELPREPCLAAFLVHRVGFEVADAPADAHRRLECLTREFAVYQMPLPEFSRESFDPLLQLKHVSHVPAARPGRWAASDDYPRMRSASARRPWRHSDRHGWSSEGDARAR